ncbi:hypothetical protein BDR05DRAFT_885766 [Suillus weaverae]|nr:hypothetical protein BDR05DRAFT_885766 [Suillus weaverae]
MAASLLTANGKGRSSWWAWELQEATKAYVQDRNNVPINPFGWRHGSSWLNDPDIANEIHEHLQSIGDYVHVEDIVTYLDNEEVKTRLKMKKTISLATAKRWMKCMDYRWVRDHHGQYIDGHEREDVVHYHQHVFLKKWAEEEAKMRTWGKDSEEICNTEWPLCVWFHDKSILDSSSSMFYANDWKKSKWVHKNTSATPYTKGEGASLMVADFVSADHGWLRSPDGKESVRILFKAGKSRDGYFSNEEILMQFENAMAIVQKQWPNEDHMFIFNNVTTHLKRPDSSLSACKMPKGTPRVGTNWGVEVTARNPEGKIIYSVDGRPMKIKIRMADGTFEDGSPQSFYFPEGHPCAGIFKGMAKILEECGYGNMVNVRAECRPNFACKPGVKNCCCRRMVYNEPDFVNVKSTLELAAESHGISVMFLPKFHCELNFIEQCWGHAKRIYCQMPPSASKEDLAKNVVDALESVAVEQMQKYVRHSHRFMDTYKKGLTGKQAAWASKKYRGHRVLPYTILAEPEKAGL